MKHWFAQGDLEMPADVDQWILTEAEYADLPSFKESSLEEELDNRTKAADYIQKIGVKLKLPQTCVATSIVLMHRFFVREKFSKFPLNDICPAFVFLASKIDEHPRKIRDVLNVALCVRFKTEDISGSFNFAEDSSQYIGLKEKLLKLEKIILQTCCFDLTIKHPYNYVFRNVKLLNDRDAEDKLVQTAWNILNTSLRTTLCIRFPPKVISAAAVYLAAARESVDLASMVGSPGRDPIDLEIFPSAPKHLVSTVFSILNEIE